MRVVLKMTSDAEVLHTTQRGRSDHNSDPILCLLKLVCINYRAACDENAYGKRLSDETAERDRTPKCDVLTQKITKELRACAGDSHE